MASFSPAGPSSAAAAAAAMEVDDSATVPTTTTHFHITGFGKFRNVPTNPTQQLVESFGAYLQEHPLPAHVRVDSLTVLETSGAGSREALQQLSAHHTPHADRHRHREVFLHFGVRADGTQFQLESTAYNVAHFRSPDERQWQPQNETILPQCAPQVCTNLNVEAMAEALTHSACVDGVAGQWKCSVSTDPGRFVCNWVYFLSLEQVKARDAHSLFIHVPLHSVYDLAAQQRFARDALITIAHTLNHPVSMAAPPLPPDAASPASTSQSVPRGIYSHAMTGEANAWTLSAPRPKRVNVVIIGCGQVARELIKQMTAARSMHLSKLGVEFEVCAMADSTGYARLRGGWTQEAASLLANKAAAGGPIAATGRGASASALSCVEDILEATSRSNDSSLIVVDCSSGATTDALACALRGSAGVVLANKKPLSGSQADWDLLHSLSGPGVARLRFESTVGAGTPFVASVRRVAHSGDSVQRMAGSFSGTLGFVMSALQKGAFSTAVNEAKAKGFTEPDPRDDLAGTDVARKALILARLLGRQVEMAQVAVEPLFPPALAKLDVPAFMTALPELDLSYAARVAEAAQQDRVLRYVATIGQDKIEVGLQSVAASSPLGRLQGTDNLLEVHSSVYASNPLVVSGAGAGAQVTASGILADMIELAAVCPVIEYRGSLGATITAAASTGTSCPPPA